MSRKKKCFILVLFPRKMLYFGFISQKKCFISVFFQLFSAVVHKLSPWHVHPSDPSPTAEALEKKGHKATAPTFSQLLISAGTNQSWSQWGMENQGLEQGQKSRLSMAAALLPQLKFTFKSLLKWKFPTTVSIHTFPYTQLSPFPEEILFFKFYFILFYLFICVWVGFKDSLEELTASLHFTGG